MHPEFIKMSSKKKETLVNPLTNNESFNNRIKKEVNKFFK